MDDSLLNKAFETQEVSEDFDPAIPPSTGHEYLQHVITLHMRLLSLKLYLIKSEGNGLLWKEKSKQVIKQRYEASKCPQIVVADIDRKKIKNHVNICLESDKWTNFTELAPSKEWQQQQIFIFSNLRKKVEISKKSDKFSPISLPMPHDEDKWYKICFGDENSRLEPSLTVLLSMSEPLLGQMLEYQTEWLEDGLKQNQGKWIYALLACLDLPLTSVVCSVLRDLARQCAKIRCSKVSNEDNDVTILNLIICLVSKYFGQTDLGD